MKNIVATIVLLVGIGLIITSSVIQSQVDDGRGQIEQAREGVSTIRRLSSLSEYSAPAGEIVANQADRRIDAGEMEANHYQTMSNWFMTLGIIATLCGAFALIYFWKKS